MPRARGQQSRWQPGVQAGREPKVGRLDALEPALRPHEKAAGGIDPLEDAFTVAGAVLDRDPFAEAEGAIEPIGADAVERLSGSPGVEPLAKSLHETLEQFVTTDRLSPCPRETRGCIAKALRRARAIDADPDNIGGPPAPKTNAFNEDAGAFRASRDQIVRPFEADVNRAKVSCGARERHPGDKAQLRSGRRRTGIDHEGAGVQIAYRRDPNAAATTSPRGLLVGYDPKAATVAGKRPAARLFVGRIDRAKSNDAPASMPTVQADGDGQKSDCAAAIAALVIGEGANMNRRIMSAETASTMRATGLGRSNAGAGSSKYISFTILR